MQASRDAASLLARAMAGDGQPCEEALRDAEGRLAAVRTQLRAQRLVLEASQGTN